VLGCLVSAGSYSYDTFCTLDFASFEPTPASSLASFDGVEQTVDPMSPAEQTTAQPIVSEGDSNFKLTEGRLR